MDKNKHLYGWNKTIQELAGLKPDMDIKEQVTQETRTLLFGVEPGLAYIEVISGKFADQIIPLARADTLKSISKESKRLDGTTYLVPDYTKFREALKELGIEE